MSSYFDAIQRDIHEARAKENDAEFRETLIAADARLFRDVTRVTGDVEFPDDLREKMLGVLAVYGCWQPGDVRNEKAIEYGMAVSFSRAADKLHELFHELARRQVKTRFGLLSDSPTQIAVLRDDHDGGKAR